MSSVLLHPVGRGDGDSGEKIRAMGLTPEEVGARIVSAREEMRPKPWSQFDLAIALGVSPSTIYRWEKGKLPSVNELIRLASVLDKPADYFTELPARQHELADLGERLDLILRFLEERRDEAVRVQAAGQEILASIHDRLLAIEQRLGIQGDQQTTDADLR